MRSAWTVALCLAPFARLASLASLALLTLKVLVNATQKAKCLEEASHLTKSECHIQNTLVGHLKSVLSKDLIQKDLSLPELLKCRFCTFSVASLWPKNKKGENVWHFYSRKKWTSEIQKSKIRISKIRMSKIQITPKSERFESPNWKVRLHEKTCSDFGRWLKQ